jgi:hypothetical protein
VQIAVAKSWCSKVARLVILLCLVAGARADFTFDIAGSTTGQFYSESLPVGTSLPGLAFTGTTFGQTAASGSNREIDLGSFSLATLVSDYNPFEFKLSVNFTAPHTGVTAFDADLRGSVTRLGDWTRVKFDNGPRHFVFTGPQGSGRFDLLLTDVKVKNSSTASIKGKIRNISASPEPSAILLTGAFMTGVLVLFRKRLRDF